MVTRNTLIPAPGRSCMTRRQTPTATATKIIHTIAQLRPEECLVLVVVVCVDMVLCTVEQRVFCMNYM
jgi:hypothetical protein